MAEQVTAVPTPIPADATLSSLFTAQTTRTPDRPAVTCDGRTLTYVELDTRARRLARTLHARGVGPGTAVGLCAEPSLSLTVGLLGILKAGGVYVPLDAKQPAGFLSGVLADSAAEMVLTHGALSGVWTDPIPVGDIDELSLADGSVGAPQPDRVPIPDDPVYVRYRSGTTGSPTGVCVSHRSVVDCLASWQRTWPLSCGDVVAQIQPCTYEAWVRELLWPLVTGARLVIPGREENRSPADVVSLVAAEQVSRVHLTPTALAEILHEPTVSRLKGVVRKVMCSGAALPADLANQALELIGAQVHTLHGPAGAPLALSSVPEAEGVSPPTGGRLGTAIRNFWRDYLAGVTEPARLELFEPGGEPGNDTVSDVPLDITGDLLHTLRRSARSAGLTLDTLVHGFWALLLARYGGRRDVLFGSAMSGRPTELSGVEHGRFANPLPVRVSVASRVTFADWLQSLQQDLSRVRQHGYAPPAEIQGYTGLAEGTQLFDTMVVARYSPAQAGTGVRERETPDGTGYPLLLLVEEAEERLRFSLRHQRSRLGSRTVERIAGHLRTLCQVFAHDPGRRLADVRILGDAEHTEVVHGFNTNRLGGIDACFTGEGTIHGLIERQAASTPFAVAATYRDETLTYQALNARANRLARHLVDRGVRREDLVAVAVSRSLDLVVTLLAVMKTGAAYVPLAADNPSERLKVMIEDARPVCFVVQESLHHLVEGQDNVCVLEREAASITTRDGDNLNAASHPDQLAYVIYTSGSSGRPKGVACHHRGLVNYLGFCARRYAYNGDGGAPLFSSVGFDMIVPNLYTPLVLGQAVHLLPDDLLLEDLAGHLLELAPFSFIKMTPGHLELLSQQLLPADAARLAGVLAVGADSFPTHILDGWRRLAPDSDILNEYGPTEASVANSIYTPTGPVGTNTVPIGRAIPNTTMYVLDEHLNPVPPGVAGEIFIGGVCPARGYLNMPERTAQSFLPDEFSAVPGARMYRTGDRGYWRSDGNLQFLRRLDDQVKIHGYRVETGEVEHKLTEHPGIEHAVVVARPNAHGHNQLVAYLVPSGPAAPRTAELRAWLERLLPSYLVPAIFVQIDAVPLDANGKVDRKALPESTTGV
ncbi:amino acid adenylation domain-containing protein [Micromonospora echinofusca]|uniref:Amino acid adenylation domain-containing protein n=1 Tax=Micromonospora echinofusca TaxID=47858 RepID=A0ABS3VIP3_MICEH|nr:amino acid adenylation domain-containing protein [Micromonospora echinofusca]MBO4204414.1 amino acid adenylation domain-containing protein [Micromonospora echinofusca]